MVAGEAHHKNDPPNHTTNNPLLTKSKLVVLSRPLVGSSKKSKLGSATISMPTLTRFRCPPLMPRVASSPMH
jgi:hypothetical protein